MDNPSTRTDVPFVSGGNNTYCAVTSGDGSVIAGWGTIAGGLQLMPCWTSVGRTTIVPFPARVAFNITGLSDDGLTIFGNGSTASGDYRGWILALPCPADFDGDRTSDFLDYDAFVNCFKGLSGPPGKTANVDGDGTVDFFDYDAFVNAFPADC